MSSVGVIFSRFVNINPPSRQGVLISLRSNDRFAYDWRESCLSCRFINNSSCLCCSVNSYIFPLKLVSIRAIRGSYIPAFC